VYAISILKKVQTFVFISNTSYSNVVGFIQKDKHIHLPMGEKKTHVMTIRIPPDLYESLLQRSEGENRSRSNLILTYLRLVSNMSPDELKTILDGRKRRSKRK